MKRASRQRGLPVLFFHSRGRFRHDRIRNLCAASPLDPGTRGAGGDTASFLAHASSSGNAFPPPGSGRRKAPCLLRPRSQLWLQLRMFAAFHPGPTAPVSPRQDGPRSRGPNLSFIVHIYKDFVHRNAFPILLTLPPALARERKEAQILGRADPRPGGAPRSFVRPGRRSPPRRFRSCAVCSEFAGCGPLPCKAAGRR